MAREWVQGDRPGGYNNAENQRFYLITSGNKHIAERGSIGRTNQEKDRENRSSIKKIDNADKEKQ